MEISSTTILTIHHVPHMIRISTTMRGYPKGVSNSSLINHVATVAIQPHNDKQEKMAKIISDYT